MLRVETLKCEYWENPINIDTPKPRFSWVLLSDERGKNQTAYRIIVSSSYENALNEVGDMWDSGKVESNENVNVEYAGKDLESFKKYYWRVRCWDQHDEASPYSDVAIFETAILKDGDWKAKWISKQNFESFTSGGDPVSGKKSYKQFYAAYFRKDFKVSGKLSRARVYISGLGLYELRINGQKVGDNVLDPGQTDYSKIALYSTYDITELVKGKNAVGVILGNGRHIESYGYGKPRLIVQILLEYLLAALAGCLNVVGHLVAKEMGIDIRALSMEISGTLNPDKLFGKTTTDRTGYKNINVVLKIDTDADENKLKEWIKAVEERCPVSDNLQHPTPIDISFEKKS